MKFILFAVLMIQSAVSFAAYSCDEKDSILSIEYLSADLIKVTHISKRVMRVPTTKVFGGQKVGKESSSYYKVENFKLSGESGEASLKVTTFQAMSRVPTCRARVCNDDGGFYTKLEISAELDEAGKITQYDCIKI